MRFLVEISLVLIFGECLLGGQTRSSDYRTSSSTEGMSCRISTADTNMKSHAKNELKVAVRNNSTMSATLDGMSIYLSPAGSVRASATELPENAYVAPVNLNTKNALQARQTQNYSWQYPITTMKIPANEERTFTIDLSPLRWGRLNEAQLPSQQLASIAAGKYDLLATLTTHEKTKITSNRILVSVFIH